MFNQNNNNSEVDYKVKYNQNNYDRSLYNQNNDYFEDEKNFDEKKGKGNGVLITIIVILVIAIAGIGMYLLFGNKSKEEIIVNFLVDEITINEGENSIISYSISNNDGGEEIQMDDSSSNENVAVVNSKGKIFGMKEGKAKITITYTVNGKVNTKTIDVDVKKNSK